MGLKRFFSWRVNILLVVLFLMLLAINPTPWAEGVQIKTVERGSIAEEQGFKAGEIIETINGREVKTISDYKTIMKEEISTKEIINESGDKVLEKTKLIITTDQREYAFLTSEELEISVGEAAKTNIKKGLDLSGGTRVLLQPVGNVTDKNLNDLISVLGNRLDVYGLADLKIRSAKDWQGNKFVLIEIAGATREEVKELMAKQGKFEAKIGNETVFIGGKGDIPYVCRGDGSCSGIRPPCSQLGQNQWYCKFEFAVHLSPEAATKHADVTKDLTINVTTEGKEVLSKMLDFYLDDKQVDSLQISADLKGKETTAIAISGPGFGRTEAEAYENALQNMDRLQTILITGSLPLKLEIVKLDTISPMLGQQFIKNALMVGLFALIAVALVIFIRYRKIKILMPMMFTSLSEIFIILGVAALIQWNLDLAAIAGIIAAVGTGVDDQILIMDEVLKGEEKFFNWKQRIKRAFFIIMAAYATTVAAMIPLWHAGAGLIRGFAVTTIIGVTIGVFITRPAFASLIEKLME